MTKEDRPKPKRAKSPGDSRQSGGSGGETAEATRVANEESTALRPVTRARELAEVVSVTGEVLDAPQPEESLEEIAGRGIRAAASHFTDMLERKELTAQEAFFATRLLLDIARSERGGKSSRIVHVNLFPTRGIADGPRAVDADA